MKYIFVAISMFIVVGSTLGQYVYTIKADTVKITASCDSGELVLKNHTQGIAGFLYNAGNGRTIFQKALQKINDTLYLVGPDSLKTHAGMAYDWIQGGNSFGATGVLGTKDNNHFDLYTNNLFRARLTNAGNFLLGTNSDNGKLLQVNGDIYQTSSNGSLSLAGGLITIQNNSGTRILTSFQGIKIYSSSTPANYFNCYDNQTSIGSSGGISFHANSTSGTGLSISSVGTSPSSTTLTFNNLRNDGTKYAFINTPDFDATLQGGSTAVPIYMYPGKEIHTGNQGNIILSYDGTNQRGNLLVGTASDNGKKLQVVGSSYFSGAVRMAGLTTDTFDTRVLVSDTLGNVSYRPLNSWVMNGIYNSSLAVNGTLSAKKLHLNYDHSWPDYVFSKGYHLASSTDLEDFILLHHHLPGVPSADEVERNGLDVGDNQAVLLKKIEELTLYSIEQDKKLQKQSNTLAQQSDALTALLGQMKILQLRISELEIVPDKRRK